MSDYDGSVSDTRTQAERIKAGDSPAGSTMYVGPSGNRIDVRQGIDVDAVRLTLQRGAARWKLEYHFSDLEGVLRATGVDKGISLERAIENALATYEKRAKN